MAIIAVLAALLLPTIGAAKHKAQRVACTSNLRQLALGVVMYSNDSHDATPSPGWTGVAGTNAPSLYSSYKALMKSYVGLPGASSTSDKIFQCPADTFYPNWIVAIHRSAAAFISCQKACTTIPHRDFSKSYAFNGGDNAAHQFFKKTFTYPGLGGVRLSDVRHPAQTVLVTEIAAFGPWSLRYNPSSHCRRRKRHLI